MSTRSDPWNDGAMKVTNEWEKMQGATSYTTADWCGFNFPKHCSSNLILPINYNFNFSVFDVGMPSFSQIDRGGRVEVNHSMKTRLKKHTRLQIFSWRIWEWRFCVKKPVENKDFWCSIVNYVLRFAFGVWCLVFFCGVVQWLNYVSDVCFNWWIWFRIFLVLPWMVQDFRRPDDVLEDMISRKCRLRKDARFWKLLQNAMNRFFRTPQINPVGTSIRFGSRELSGEAWQWARDMMTETTL